jgi:hypothetical protein
MTVEPIVALQSAIAITEDKTNEVERLRSWLCLMLGWLRAAPVKSHLDELLIDAISRELGINDISLQQFRRNFEAMAGK